MDDVEDDSQLRRGAPVAHKIYGIPQTINTANYVYFLAYQELFKLRDWDASDRTKDLDKVVTEELLNLHRGQGLDLLWRDTLECPTEAEYVEMVNNKTGGLFRIAIKLMMALSPVEPKVDYVPLVNLIGVYFQIRDDYMNLQSGQVRTRPPLVTCSNRTNNTHIVRIQQGFAEDLTEGKFSFLVVHAVRADRSNRQVLNVLQKRPATPTLKKHVISYMEDKTGTFEYTRETGQSNAGGNITARRNPKLEKFIQSMKID
ncbi:Terpenoid synthase [Rhizoctonia solani]|uniref:(2E,6E)-farnesyl diphosphate synthase n=1 Tax=Rhizoctonia solani TaxID=456999 RepID=A0A8H7M7Q5_9AGAM|nr:Terpenoid synthase [Rhizoctonia solani]